METIPYISYYALACLFILAQQSICAYTSKNSGASATGVVEIQSGNEYDLQAAVASVGPVAVSVDANTYAFRVCVHACTHTYTHAHTHTHTHTHSQMHTHTHTHTHKCTHARTHIHTLKCTYTHTQTHTRTHTCAWSKLFTELYPLFICIHAVLSKRCVSFDGLFQLRPQSLHGCGGIRSVQWKRLLALQE